MTYYCHKKAGVKCWAKRSGSRLLLSPSIHSRRLREGCDPLWVHRGVIAGLSLSFVHCMNMCTEGSGNDLTSPSFDERYGLSLRIENYARKGYLDLIRNQLDECTLRELESMS